MYAVYYWKYTETDFEKYLLYAPNSGEDGYFISSGKFEKGINMAGSLTAVVPPTNPAWKHFFDDGSEGNPHPIELSKGTILSVELVQDGIAREIWRGRVISQSWDIYRNMTVNCEGILAYFNDVLLPAYNFSWTGVISHAYDPAEGLKYANLDALKDFLPNLSTDGIQEAVTGVVEKVVGNDSFTPDQNEIYDTISKGLPVQDTTGTTEDNTDRRVTVYDYLLFVLTMYNTELTQHPVDIRKQIKVGYVDPVFNTEKYLINHKTDKYTNTWEEINSNILEVYGGVMFLSNWYKNSKGEEIYDKNTSYLYYYKDAVGDGEQVIQYGENLVNFEMEVDQTERVSRWYVFGSTKDANGKETIVDMSSVNNGLKYIAAPMTLGTISKVEYTDLTTPQDCYNKAWELLRKSLWSVETHTVNAIDLHLLDHSIKAFEPGYKFRLVMSNKAYDISSSANQYILESVSIDLLSPENSECVFKLIGSDIQ